MISMSMIELMNLNSFLSMHIKLITKRYIRNKEKCIKLPRNIEKKNFNCKSKFIKLVLTTVKTTRSR